jgi:catechol 2,3-dioxygenase-like lactoylglutathione lyase family enzyme
MTDCRPRLTAILPCINLDASTAFFARLGFHRSEQDIARVTPGEPDTYRILTNERGDDVHLTDCPEGWLVPGKNPFGLYLYVEDVDAVAREMADVAIGKGAGHREWGMYEVALNGPDDVLVRVGWPSRLIREKSGES